MWIDKRGNWHVINRAPSPAPAPWPAARAFDGRVGTQCSKPRGCRAYASADAYDVSQFTDCGTSILSTHFFSKDGKNWRAADDEPYGHTVHFDDGTVHTYTTLERPNIHFDSTGQMTHLGLAADLVTGNEGCANRTWRSGGKTCCTNCKYNDHAGTLLVKLQQ